MQSFTRKLHVSSLRAKNVAKFIDTSKNIPQLRSTPTIYNPKSSASNPKGYMKAKIPGGLYYQPAQSSPTGSINSETYPTSFLPAGDSRRTLIEKLRSDDRLQGDHAPPVLTSKSTMTEKTYHLKPSDVAEIQRLRSENPEVYTRKALAQQFKVSRLFISLVSDASTQRKQEMDSRLDQIKSQWHEKRRAARTDRIKRKQYWYRP
ncbi:hypothetical protein HG537_0G02390 [Torulaspora globosa]|uniref:Uncharacterized protein n=1 Tax=Torulaspora globosa TaxID=48254 RepID=A0A7H9HZH4_9SACH|nr:hypothetical protein HG537_0G02390 [Torulaspora sp. CBS 2947]